MPLFFLLVGIMLIIVGINNKLGDLGTLIKEDFSPTSGGNFSLWIVALFVIGSLGYIKAFKPVANAFIVLILLVLILANNRPGSPNGGFFANFTHTVQGS